MVQARQIQVDTILKLISIQYTWKNAKEVALNFSEDRTEELTQLTMKEAVLATDCLLIAVEHNNCLMGIYQMAIDIGIIKGYKASSSLNFENIESFLLDLNYLKHPFCESTTDQLRMAKAYMIILERYCKEFRVPKKNVLFHAKEAWGVMQGKAATDTLLQELNLTTESTPRSHSKKNP